MRKGFTRKPKPDAPATPVKNYITPSGLERLKDEHRFLLTRERPAVVEVVAWAAGNGDRGVTAFHEKAGRSQVGSIVFSLVKVFSCRVATVATLPSALFVSALRPVQVGCSRFSRCCHLFGDLGSISKMKAGPGD
jgi:hypothetical protein